MDAICLRPRAGRPSPSPTISSCADPIDVDASGRNAARFRRQRPAIRTVSIISVTGDQTDVVASTSSDERLCFARREARRGRASDGRHGRSARQHDRRDAGARDNRADAAAVVTVSLGSRPSSDERARVTLWFTPIVVLLGW